MERIKYKHIYKRTIKRHYGEYEYYVVQLRSNGNKMNYIGCSRKYEKAEKMLLDYAETNDLNQFELLK